MDAWCLRAQRLELTNQLAKLLDVEVVIHKGMIMVLIDEENMVGVR